MSESSQSAQEARLQLYDIMGRDLPFEAKARQALELGKSYLGVDNAHLPRIDQNTGYWEILVSTDGPDETFPRGLVLDLDTTYCRRVLEEGDSIALHDAPDQGWDDDPAYETHGLRCYHGSPLTVGGDQYGTVCFVSDSARGEPFSESDTLFAELIARLLEHELERRRHEAETTRRANSITVLSRVLRHNLRNEMTVVRGRIGAMVDELEETPYISDALFDSIDRIIALSDKARKLETVVSTRFDRNPVVLEPLLERVVNEAELDHPAGTVAVTGDTDVTIEARDSLELALAELVENGLKHGGENPLVRVTVTADDETVRLAVSDDGPGLPPQEEAVLDEGVETPLIHGSGLGLWMVHWIVSSHDGTIETTVTDDGTTINVTLPRVDTDEGAVTADDVQALQRGVDRFEAIFEESFDAMLLVDDDRRIVDANAHAAELFGLPADELLGRRVQSFADEDFDSDAVWEHIQATGAHEGWFPLVSADGTERVLEYSATADVVPGQHLLIGRDVTERIERDRELAETTRQLQGVLDTMEAAVFIKDDEGRYQLMNGLCRDLLDIDHDADVEGLTDEDLFPADVAGSNRDADRTVLEHGETVEVEEEIPTAEGTRTFLTRKSPMYDEQGRIEGLVAVSTDITERKEHEEAVRETKNRLEAVVEASPDPIIALDADGVVEQWNEAAEEVFGYAAEEVLGEHFRDLGIVDADQQSGFAERFQRAMQGERFEDLEVQRKRKDGDPVTLHISTAPITDDEGEVDGLVAVARDVTDGSE